jgi:hypothetical protein
MEPRIGSRFSQMPDRLPALGFLDEQEQQQHGDQHQQGGKREADSRLLLGKSRTGWGRSSIERGQPYDDGGDAPIVLITPLASLR